MPKVRPLSPEEQARLKPRAQPKQDLSAYHDLLAQMPLEEWVSLELGEDEKPRTEKRRLTTVAKLRGQRLIYRPGEHDKQLYVRLTARPKQVRGPRKPKAEVQ